MTLYDITPRITQHLAVWPGDTPPTREVLCDLARGDSVTLSTLHATVHLGAHADAPSHYQPGGVDIANRALDVYLGRCQVIAVSLEGQQEISPSALPDTIAAPRVLLATNTVPDPTEFRESFASLSPEAVALLARSGVRLIGIDTPSVDRFDSKTLPAHHACAKADISILEGLRLEGVPEGIYELIALPLPLVGFDASPVRAILRTWSPHEGSPS